MTYLAQISDGVIYCLMVMPGGQTDPGVGWLLFDTTDAAQAHWPDAEMVML